MKYKRIETKNGRVQYWVDGKMTSHKNIPESILGQLEGNMELEIGAATVEQKAPDEAPEIKREDRKCFIDGKPGPFKKFLQLQTVYLCEEHQHSLTTGEVVEQMRIAGILE